MDQYCIIKIVLYFYEGQKLPIDNAMYFYDDQYGQSYIICANQELYFKDGNVALMSTFQETASGAVVSNIPKHFDKISPLSISFPDQDLYIPFLIKGTTCYIPLRAPNEAKVHSLTRLNLTLSYGTWDPSSSKFEVINTDLFNSNLSQYSHYNPN